VALAFGCRPRDIGWRMDETKIVELNLGRMTIVGVGEMPNGDAEPPLELTSVELAKGGVLMRVPFGDYGDPATERTARVIASGLYRHVNVRVLLETVDEVDSPNANSR